MKRYHPGVLMAFLMVSALHAFPSAQQAQTGKPNIVVIFMDNLGWGHLGVYGAGILRGAPTPRIDKPASEGMRLLHLARALERKLQMGSAWCALSRAHTRRSRRWVLEHQVRELGRNGCPGFSVRDGSNRSHRQ